jgi:hypothetical protein
MRLTSLEKCAPLNLIVIISPSLLTIVTRKAQGIKPLLRAA